MATELEALTEQIKKFNDNMGNFEKSLEKLNTPVHEMNEGGRRVGYSYTYEDEAPKRIAKGYNNLVSLSSDQLDQRNWRPAGYEPYGFAKSFGQMVNEMVTDKGFSQRYAGYIQNVQKTVQGMSEGIGSDGGFMVMPEFSMKIFEKLYTNSVWEMTDNYQIGGNTMTFPRNAETSRKDGFRAGGILGYWVNEGATIPATKPQIAQLELKLKKVAVVVYLTEELIQDAGMALEAYVNRKVGEEFKFQVGNKVINGKGPGGPQGIMNSNALITIAAETQQKPKSIVTQNIVNMWARLFAGSRSNAVWWNNQDTEGSLNLMTLGVGTGGVVTYMPPGGLSGAQYATLMGRPVVPLEFCQTLGTPGDLILADPKQYVTISKGGIAQAQSIHVEFLTDQVALRFTMRVDGATWENSPVTPFNGTNTQSSFLVLAAR